MSAAGTADITPEVAYKLVANDGVVFVVKNEILDQSKTLSMCVDFVGKKGAMMEIPTPKVDGATLKLLIDYCEQHKNEPKNEDGTKRELTDWDKEFFGPMSLGTMMGLMRAADYLMVEGLASAASQYNGQKLTATSVATTRKMFGLPEAAE